jgi:hypothetical protein
VTSSMFDILNRMKRIVVPCVAAAALIAPSAAWAMQGGPPSGPVVTPEIAALPDLPPTQAAVIERPAPADNLAAREESANAVVATSDDGFDFGDAGIGVAVVAGACALLLAVAAFFVGRRRRLGASPS